jgi:hypothetical protein
MQTWAETLHKIPEEKLSKSVLSCCPYGKFIDTVRKPLAEDGKGFQPSPTFGR